MSNFDNTNSEHPLVGFESLMAIDPTTGIPLVTAFAPRTQSEVEARQWFAFEMRRLQWQANRRRYRFDGKDEKPCGEEPKDV